jgi:hypothetical protein
MLMMAMGMAWAGDAAKHTTATTAAGKAAGAEKMKAMQAAMMKCSVCKHMAVKMDQFGPMTMDVAKLNDGIAVIHGVNDPSKAAAFHAACKEVKTAGEACMTMTDEQAKTDLCEFCQSIRGIMKSGGKMSNGETKTGDVMVLTSSDPAVQAQIMTLGDKCAMMAEM